MKLHVVVEADRIVSIEEDIVGVAARLEMPVEQVRTQRTQGLINALKRNYNCIVSPAIHMGIDGGEFHDEEINYKWMVKIDTNNQKGIKPSKSINYAIEHMAVDFADWLSRHHNTNPDKKQNRFLWKEFLITLTEDDWKEYGINDIPDYLSKCTDHPFINIDPKHVNMLGRSGYNIEYNELNKTFHWHLKDIPEGMLDIVRKNYQVK